MRVQLKTLVALAKETISHWIDDNAPALAAALSYYALFSLAPLLLIAVAVAGLVFGNKAAEGQLSDQIAGLIGSQGAATVQSLMAAMHERTSGGIVATVVGLLILVLGATGVFVQLQDSLNAIWKVRPPLRSSILAAIRARFLSFSMVLGTGFLLLVSLVLSAALAALGAYVGGFIPEWIVLGHVINSAMSIAAITVLFAMIYKVLPDTYVAWRDVWLGALVTAFLFTLGKFAIGLYLGQASVASSYGAAGSVVILLLWVYYSSLILYLGAEFTHVYALHRQRRDASRPLPTSEGRPPERVHPPEQLPARS